MIHVSQKLIRAIRSHFSGPRDRGAAVVETAIAIPILLLVIMGSIEFGFAWEAKSASTSGVRTGVLRAASVGDKPETDMRILQSIAGEIGPDNVDRIEWVVIFEASAADRAATIASCAAGNAGSCVRYDSAFITSAAAATDAGAFQALNFDDGAGGDLTTQAYTCDTSKLDSSWCAGKRSEFDQDVQIGVAIRYTHEWFTGIFPFDPPTYEDYSVSSTFLSDGAQVTGSTGTISIPNGIGQVFDFDGSVIPAGVTNGTLGSLPIDGEAAQGVLGLYGSETVTITAPTTDPHTQVCVSATIWIIGSWDAASGKWGPDTFDIDIGGTDTGINNQVYDQADGKNDTDLDASHPGTKDYAQEVVIFECVPHTGDSVSVDFSAILIQNSVAKIQLKDESWALGDVTITVNS